MSKKKPRSSQDSKNNTPKQPVPRSDIIVDTQPQPQQPERSDIIIDGARMDQGTQCYTFPTTQLLKIQLEEERKYVEKQKKKIQYLDAESVKKKKKFLQCFIYNQRFIKHNDWAR